MIAEAKFEAADIDAVMKLHNLINVVDKSGNKDIGKGVAAINKDQITINRY